MDATHLGIIDRLETVQKTVDTASTMASDVRDLGHHHANRLWAQEQAMLDSASKELQAIARDMPADTRLVEAAATYLVDRAERWVLYWDVLRQRGDAYIAHEQAGSPPVLVFDYDMILDGRTLDRPCNYALVKIKHTGPVEPEAHRRPYVIIDPRAGHGAGIGGSKSESQVGVAMRDGHPVYFVIFFPQPEPGQTLADVCSAEAEFIRTVRELHPDAPRPIVVGNCQGGWATMLLAATNPDLTGPIIVNGAPLSYWAGENGKNPMRYLGGLVGGSVPALIASDLGNGVFDGANLVLNFETYNPGNVWWRKYYNLFAAIDTEAERYLEFEKWWGGFFFMNENEIRWIVDNLFVGNKLARMGTQLDARTHLDLKNIRSPVIVFASRGDNITPPQQALNWIADTYRDAHEIKVKGQRIIYLLHDGIGHLGIFVSSKVAKKEHAQISSTVKTIEALAPGLYEMVIKDVEGHGIDAVYTVDFEERTIDDLLLHDDGRDDEALFAGMSRVSALNEEMYDLFMRPWVKAMVTPASADWLKRTHPLRQRRYLPSSRNPMMQSVGPLATSVRDNRHQVDEANPFVRLEHFWAGWIEQNWNLFRDARDAWSELLFHGVYGSPAMRAIGDRELDFWQAASAYDLRKVPEVQIALSRLNDGSFADGVIRMLILLAKSRGSVRRSRLERSDRILHTVEPFTSLSAVERARIINEQALIVDLEPEKSFDGLPRLIKNMDDRRRALSLAYHIAGPVEEMSPATIAMFDRLKALLEIEQIDPFDLPEAAE